MAIRVFEVGGCVRDALLGIPSKDVDFLLVGAPSFEDGVKHAKNLGLHPINGTLRPEFATFKAAVPKGHHLRERCNAVDFVLARKDGFHSDGRRPDSTEPGTLEDDLRRRDFTVNALARCPVSGEIVDLFGGQAHLEKRVLHFVGDPMTRIREDGLRVLRGFRFSVTKGFTLGTDTWFSLICPEASMMLARVAIERVREELENMLRKDTLGSLRLMESLPVHAKAAIFRDGLRLSATLKES